MKLPRGNAVPLYHQIYLTLRDDIVSGRKPCGSLMPTEHELIQSMGVSRITARRALDELAGHGFVERRRRTGTRVIFDSPAAPIEANLEQAVESLVAFGRNTQVRVAEFGGQKASPSIAAKLGIKEGERILHAVRLRLSGGEILGQIESFVPARLHKSISRKALTTTPILDILRKSGIAIRGGRQIISAIVADAAMAQTLGVESRSAVLCIERTVTDADGHPLLLTIAHYRADRYRISVDFHAGA
ncbi:MAG TPA: GntR family transcriptional regulator [Steroidobacteraceae bacterium]|jgi:GntR family transcriptional regulator